MNPLPLFPEGGEHLWGCFADLCATRQIGLSANPITYTEIDAYSRSTHADLRAADVRLIRQMDDRVAAVRAGEFNPASPTGRKPGIGSFLKQQAAASRRRKAEQ